MSDSRNDNNLSNPSESQSEHDNSAIVNDNENAAADSEDEMIYSIDSDIVNDLDTLEIDLSFIGEKKKTEETRKDEKDMKFKKSKEVTENKINDNVFYTKNMYIPKSVSSKSCTEILRRKILLEHLKEIARRESYLLNKREFKEKSIPADKSKINILKELKRKHNKIRDKKMKKRKKRIKSQRDPKKKIKEVVWSSPEKESVTSSLEASQIESFADFSDSMFEYKIKNKSKIYQCPEPSCSQELPSLSRIKRHYLVHTNIKPFKCLNPDCKKRFSRKDNMLQHYRTHCNGKKKKKNRGS